MRTRGWSRSLSFVVAGVFIPCLSAVAAWQPGLQAGYLDSAWDTVSYPTFTEVQLGPHAGATTAQPPWAENRTWVYTGQIYLDGSTYHFAENIDNCAMLMIGGTTYLNDEIYTTPTRSGPVTLAAGWYDVEIRLGNAVAGGGPRPTDGWTSTKGFGYNVAGPDTTDGTDYLYPEDNGTMILFRNDDGAGGVLNEPASGVTSSGAVLSGRLLSTNTANAVTVYWGPADGGTNALAWTNHADFPFPATQGVFSTNVALSADTLTFFRYAMSNETVTAWAESTETVLTGDVTVQVLDAEVTEGTIDTGTLRVSRPATATNGPLTVCFALGGTAVNAVDYVGVADNRVVIPEGEASVDLVIEGIEDARLYEGDEDVTLVLQEGNYTIGTVSPVSLTLHDGESPEQWAHGVPIIFSGYSGAEVLTNFPALVQVDTAISGFSYDGMLSGEHDDLRFMNDSKAQFLNYEVESWDTNGTSHVWVQVPLLTNNAVIWMYWGRAGSTAPAYTSNGATWSNGYMSVWHFSEASGTSLKDSVGNYNGVVEAGVSLAADGFVGGGGNFDGTVNGGVALSGLTKLVAQHQLTVSGWMYLDTLGTSDAGDSCIFTTSTSSDPVLFWYNYTANTSGDKVYSFNVGASNISTNRVNTASGVAKAQTWQYVGGVLNNNFRALYVDGALRVTGIGERTYVGGTTSGYLGKWTGSSNFSHDGGMDEVRISTVARSGDWMRAEYLNMASNRVFQSALSLTPSLLVAGLPQAFGTPDPAYGTTNLAGGEIFTCEAPAFVDMGNGVGYACTGYSLYTNLVEWVRTGVDSSCVYTNSGGSDRLVWQWTLQYYVAFTNDGPGTFSTTGGWYDAGTAVTSTAIGQDGGQFAGWVDPQNIIPSQQAYASITVPVTEPLQLTAHFIPPFKRAGWSKQLLIRFVGYNRSETLTNCPVMVVFSDNLAGHFRYADMASPADAGDLRFTAADGQTELFYDIEKWDTNGTSTVWVRLPRLSSGEDKIYAYWGNPTQADLPVYTGNGITWDNGFVAVYHLAEDSGAVKDSSPFGNGLGVYGDVQQGTNGIAGPAAAWPDGGNDWLQRPSASALDGMSRLTLQAWIYDEQNDTQPRGLISKRLNSDNYSGQKSYYFFKYQNRNIFFYIGNDGGEFTGTATGANQWNFVAGTYDRHLLTSQMKVYVDGALKNSKSNITNSVPVYGSALHVGVLNAYYEASGLPCCWKGKLDEVRISNVARSADWLWAEYMNTASNAVFQVYEPSFTGTMLRVW